MSIITGLNPLDWTSGIIILPSKEPDTVLYFGTSNACEMMFAETTAKYEENTVVLYPDPICEERVW